MDEPPVWTPEIEWMNRSKEFALSVLKSRTAAYFFLGMATEAFDIAFSSAFNLIYHPGIDFVIWVFIAMAFLYFQKRYPNAELEREDGSLESQD
jgi:hypothetical protein